MEKNNEPVSRSFGNSRKKTAAIIALILCAVMILGLVGVFEFRSSSGSESPAEETPPGNSYLSDSSLSPSEKLSLAVSEHDADYTKKVTDAEINVVVGGEARPALYTGTVYGNTPSGSGLYEFSGPDGDWTFFGTLNGSAISSGKVTDYPYAFEFSDEGSTSKYTGNLSNGMPQGVGSFLVTTPDGEITLNGYFDNEKNFNGDVENYSLAFEYNGVIFNGKYSGKLVSGLPDGDGSFHADGETYYDFSGTWKEGSPVGPGTLSTNNASFFTGDGTALTAVYEGGLENSLFCGEGTMTTGDQESGGYAYTGSWKDGSFSGEGTLFCYDPEGKGYSYRGGFNNGAYHGYGELIFDDPQIMKYIGNFENGSYRPAPVHLISSLCTGAAGFELSDQVLAYLSSHADQLLSHNSDDLYFGDGFSYYGYAENPVNPDDRCFTADFRVVSIREYTESSFGIPVSEILGYADNGNRVYYGFYLGHIPEYENKDTLNITAYPLGFSPYRSLDGTDIPSLRFVAFEAY